MGLQSGMIEFEVDQTQLQRIELKLKDMRSAMRWTVSKINSR